MTFATTCPQCKTSFKVVPEQLERGRGLVRCGVCKHVFAGADHLRYVDELDSSRPAAGQAEAPAAAHGEAPAATQAEAPAAAQAEAPAAAQAEAPAAAQAEAPAAAQAEAPAAARAEAPAAPPVVPRRQDEPAAAAAPGPPSLNPLPGAPLFPPPAEGEWDPLEAIGATAPERDGDMLIASRDDGYSAGQTGPAGVAMSAGDPARGPGRGAARAARATARASARHAYLEPTHDPGSIAGVPALGGDQGRQATEAEADPHAIFTQAPSSWRASLGSPIPEPQHADAFAEPRRRNALIALVVLLVLAAVQLTLLFRSEIANAVPALRPAADLVAGAFGLKVEAARSIASLSIESTELQRVGGAGQAALHALLRNKDSRTIRWPAMELTLTDAAGAVVLRKVILPTEYLPASAPRDGLRALSEWPIRLALDAGGLAIANYSVTLFYP